MKIKKEKIYLFFKCFFLFLLCLIFFILKYYDIQYKLDFLINQNFLKENNLIPNLNYIKVENRIYYNKSFGLNYLDICQKQYLMKFNRKIPNINSNILITLILMYNNPFDILKSVIKDYIDILCKEVDFNFSLAIITCNHDISDLLKNHTSQINLKFFSRFTLKNIEIPNSECFSFVTYSRNRIIDVFYTNTNYSKFDKNFLYNSHYTSIYNFKFTGFYAASTNYYTYVPSHIGLFDYFDFFIKFDYDLLKDLKNNPLFEPFPLRKMILNNKYFFFGCRLDYDNYFVTTNLYKTFFMSILKQSDKCSYTVLPKNLYKIDESINSSGALNICWLGFYSMLEIRFFSEEYLSAPYGLYENRWGDQQFFIPVLFGFNFKKFSYFSNNTYLCSWVKKYKN